MENSGGQYCALCCSTIYNGNFKIIGVTNDILEVILLKLDFDNGSNKVMCEVCSQKVIEAFKFKSMCLYTDNTLIPYVDDETEFSIDLREIYAKENGIKPLTDLLDGDKVCRLCMQLIKTELISVRDINIEMINIYIPEINFRVVKDAVICKHCFDFFDSYSSFIREYLEVKENIKSSLISCIKAETIEIKSEGNETDEELSQTISTVAKSENEKVYIKTKSVAIQTDERLQFYFDNEDASSSEFEDLLSAEKNSAIQEGNDLCEESIQSEKNILCTYCGILVDDIKEHICEDFCEKSKKAEYPTKCHLKSTYYDEREVKEAFISKDNMFSSNKKFAIVRFKNAVIKYLPIKNIKFTGQNTGVTKWKGYHDNVVVVGFADKEACDTIVKNLNQSLPFIALRRCDSIAATMKRSNVCSSVHSDVGRIVSKDADTKYLTKTTSEHISNSHNSVPFVALYRCDSIAAAMKRKTECSPSHSFQTLPSADIEICESTCQKHSFCDITNEVKNSVPESCQEITHQDNYVTDESLFDEIDCDGESNDLELPRPKENIPNKKKVYKKKRNHCTFCKNTNTNIERHFQQIHKAEEEVKKFLKLPKNCLERRHLIALLRQRGNFEHNLKAMHTDGQLVVARRMKRNIPKAKYAVCPNCKIFITKPALRRHYRRCNKNTSTKKNNRGILSRSRALLKNIHPCASET